VQVAVPGGCIGRWDLPSPFSILNPISGLFETAYFVDRRLSYAHFLAAVAKMEDSVLTSTGIRRLGGWVESVRRSRGGYIWAYRPGCSIVLEVPGASSQSWCCDRCRRAVTVGAIRAAEPRHTIACCCVPLSVAAADVSVSWVCCAPAVRRHSRRGHRMGFDLRKRVFGWLLSQGSSAGSNPVGATLRPGQKYFWPGLSCYSMSAM